MVLDRHSKTHYDIMFSLMSRQKWKATYVCIKTDYFLINICFISSSKGFTTQCCFQTQWMSFEGGLFHINLTTIKVNEP